MPALIELTLRLALLIGIRSTIASLALSLQTRSPMVTADRRFAAALAWHDELATLVLLLDQPA